ncbi:ABC transporter permease [Aureimonas frigidaquae]|uniref:Permease component of ribose/xylose/arabinose/galactoside ABC-type transporter n=1 Tax=Aureimonas frigidaquae TaxID=424757 RepID=A0A0P0Z2A6_9HYPH|nr:ABC transporter permease [Aureimonas frigidaquae]BAT28187.1 permease component of ribose/xylose/arabinose/galactoside ABC-type transporter [Aureimonas frigidaquae]
MSGLPSPVAVARLKLLAPLFFLIFAAVVVAVLAPGFASASTLLIVLADTSTLFVLAAGLSFVIMLGSIDLSVPAVASLASVLTALLLPQIGWLAFPAALGAGLAVGLCSGIVHVALRIPSFIATLATGGVVSGIALYVSDARAIGIGQAERQLLGWISGVSFGLPNIVLVAAVALSIGVYIQRYTRFGRYSTAIGAGEPAARASGIRVSRQKVLAFGLSGLFASLAGIMLAARLTSGSPTGASQLLLPAIAAVIVGGTAITGGVGGVAQTLVGALIVSVVRIGMTFLGVDIFAQQIVFGLVLIFAVAVTMDRANILIAK